MENKSYKESLLTMISRQNLHITGVEKVHSVSDNTVYIDANGSGVQICGDNLFVQKLDVENGQLELTGLINSIKYVGKKDKIPFLKRIFK